MHQGSTSEDGHLSTQAAEADDGIFQLREDGLLEPTRLAQGPWNPNHLHGGAIAGALGRAIESAASPVPMRVTRLAIDLTRAVPMEPLGVEVRVTRAGKRIQRLEAVLAHGEQEVARAHALRIRVDADQAVAEAPPEESVPARGGAVQRLAEVDHPMIPGFIRAVDYERSDTPAAGRPTVAWARLRCRLVEGEDASPFVRLATLCDFASGTGNPLDFTQWTSINPDLTLHVSRLPRSEWIAVKAWTQLEADGIGQSNAILFDEEGVVGRAMTSLLVQRR